MADLLFPARMFNVSGSEIVDYVSGQILALGGYYDIFSHADFLRLADSQSILDALQVGDLILTYGTDALVVPPISEQVPFTEIQFKYNQGDNTSIGVFEDQADLNELPDGARVVFTFDDTNVVSDSVFLYYNGVRLKRGLDFTVVGSTITFIPSPENIIPTAEDTLWISLERKAII